MIRGSQIRSPSLLPAVPVPHPSSSSMLPSEPMYEECIFTYGLQQGRNAKFLLANHLVQGGLFTDLSPPPKSHVLHKLALDMLSFLSFSKGFVHINSLSRMQGFWGERLCLHFFLLPSLLAPSCGLCFSHPAP